MENEFKPIKNDETLDLLVVYQTIILWLICVILVVLEAVGLI